MLAGVIGAHKKRRTTATNFCKSCSATLRTSWFTEPTKKLGTNAVKHIEYGIRRPFLRVESSINLHFPRSS
jgi:hypothetical protein